ncbi:Uncharacterized iron-regulated membrane protein [Duganella sp. CF458]|uniref:PepSY-associated TM helix domain-containing protein n=1 Tax=Duganella sp. CF458 TaxID=1884368 RepID=UPI0008F22ECC|nr:PepSY domain-containing protein [Duganella sp. CF458]SFF94962.1 Uncharacterized iron-regulated membrane protein [Duganella sp. CF458]
MTDQRMKSARTALLWRVHWWAALVASPFALVAALTGLLYAFTPQIEARLYGAMELVQPVEKHVSLDAMVGAAHATAPAMSQLHSVVVPAAPDESVKVTFAAGGADSGEHQQHAGHAPAAPKKPAFGPPAGAVTYFVDPADAKVLGSQANEERFSQWAKRLHSRLLQGETWRWMIELATSWLMVMLLTGVALWWPKASLPKLGKRGREAWRQWHAFFGVGFGVLTLIILTTGLTWSKYAGEEVRYLRDLTGQASPKMPRGLASEHADPATAMSWQTALDKARALAPGVALQLTPPAGPHGIWKIGMAERSRPQLRFDAALDAYSGRVLYRSGWDEQTAFGKATTVGIPFHRGEFGWWNQALLIVFGVGTLFSLVSGWVMYFKRRKAGQLGLPKVPGGAWRAIGFGWAAGALACLALMPMLLLSAPCVLLADRLLASVMARW